MSTLRKHVLTYLLGMSIILTCYQCSVDNEKRVVAQIDDLEISYSSYKEQFEKVNPGTSISTAKKEQKQKVLDEMINQQIVLLEAFRLGYDRNEKVLEYIKSREKVLAGEALRTQEVDNKILNEEVIQKFYKWLDKEIHLLRMKFVFKSDNKNDAENKAQNVYQKLVEGASFRDLAVTFSEHKTAKQDSGDMKVIGCYNIYEKIFEKAYLLKEGEFSKPFEYQNAFYIIQSEKIHSLTRATLEEEKPQIIKTLKEYYKQNLSQQFYQFKKNIKDEYQFTLNSENLIFFCERAKKITSRKDSLGIFNEEDKKRVLSTTKIEETTIGEFLPLAFPYYWDSLNQERLVKMLLSERSFRRAVNHKGMQLKLNELPKVKEQLDEWKVRYYKNFTLQMEVVDKINITDMKLMTLYDKQKNQLKLEEQRVVREIFRKTKEDIDMVYRLALEGNNFAALEAKYQENRETKTQGILGPFSKGPHGKLGEMAFSMKVNDVSKPFRYRGGYSIIQLLSITPARQQTFDEVKEQLKTGYISENKDAFIFEWISKNKERYDIIQYKI